MAGTRGPGKRDCHGRCYQIPIATVHLPPQRAMICTDATQMGGSSHVQHRKTGAFASGLYPSGPGIFL